MENFEEYKNTIYDVGGGPDNEISLLETLDYLGYDNYVHDEPRTGDVRHFVSDNKKITAVNGWEPTIGWKKGIDRTVKNYKKKFKKQN